MKAALRRGWCPGALRPMPAKDGLLVRLRITGGILVAAHAHALADLAERCGNGLFDLSGRGNLQMRGVRADALERLQDGLGSLGMVDASVDAEAVRNVLASPLAGLHRGLDIRPLVATLEARLADDESLHGLPAKFGFLVDDGHWPMLAGIDADVRFDWTGRDFAIGIGGTRANARYVGVCGPAEVTERAVQLASAFLVVVRKNSRVRRMRDAVDSIADACGASPSPARGRRWPDEVGSDEGCVRLLDVAVRSGTSPHPTPADAGATFSREREKVGPRTIVGFHASRDRESFLGLAAPFGRLDSGMLRGAAEAAAGELRLTPWRVLLLPGTAATHVPGFITDPADRRLGVAACVGARGCERGTTDTQADAAVLAAALPDRGDATLHLSGCEKGCAKPSPTPLTLVARNGRYDLVLDGRAGDPPWRRGLDLAEARELLLALA